MVSYVRDSRTIEKKGTLRGRSARSRRSQSILPRLVPARSARVTRILAQPGSPVPGRHRHHATCDSSGRVGKPERTRRRPPGPPSSPCAQPTNQPGGHLRSLGFPFLFRKHPEGSSARLWPGSVARMNHRGVPDSALCPGSGALYASPCKWTLARTLGAPRRHFSSPLQSLLLLRHERVPLSSTPALVRCGGEGRWHRYVRSRDCTSRLSQCALAARSPVRIGLVSARTASHAHHPPAALCCVLSQRARPYPVVACPLRIPTHISGLRSSLSPPAQEHGTRARRMALSSAVAYLCLLCAEGVR
ncbi:hypothetical protein MTO96_021102 [Rhipicephalus appendiculatus]